MIIDIVVVSCLEGLLRQPTCGNHFLKDVRRLSLAVTGAQCFRSRSQNLTGCAAVTFPALLRSKESSPMPTEPTATAGDGGEGAG